MIFECQTPSTVLDVPRQAAIGAGSSLLARALDMIDQGVVLLLADMRVVYLNVSASHELGPFRPLQLIGQELTARRPEDMAELRQAVANACEKDLQQMLSIGGPDAERQVLSILPMPRPGLKGECGAMLIFAKRSRCIEFTIEAYARLHRLTAAEVKVLTLLCEGRRPAEIARAQGVKMSTVRAQIGSIRQKVGASCVVDLVLRMSRLPPMPLRAGSAAGQSIFVEALATPPA